MAESSATVGAMRSAGREGLVGLVTAIVLGCTASSAHAGVSVSDATAVGEGTPNAALSFTVTKTYVALGASQATVRFRTTGGTATAGADYTATTVTVTLDNTLLAGDSEVVTVPVLPDTLDEPDETVAVTIDNATGDTSITTATASGTIVDDDPTPTVSLAGSAAPEGTGAAGYVPFTVTLSAVSGRQVTVPYTVNPGTAEAPADIDAAAGQLVIPAGQATGEIRIPTVADDVDEPDELFSVTLGTPTNAALGAPTTATGTVVNDDAPVVSISGVSGAEGTSTAPTPFTFTVSLSKAGRLPVSVRVRSGDVQAVAPGDYGAVDQTVTFAVGETSKTVTVNVVADAIREPDEAFTMTLSDPVAATLGTSVALGAIINDDAATPAGTGTGTGTGTGSGTSSSSGTGTGGGTGTATPTGPIDASQPVVRLTGLTYRRTGRTVRVKVTCPASETRCTGTVTVFNIVVRKAKVKGLRREVRLARGTFVLEGGKSRTVTMKTTSAGKKLITAAKRVKVRAYAVARDPAGNTGISTKSATFKR